MMRKKRLVIKKHGLDNFSLDLIYGLPGQSIESFQESMCDDCAGSENILRSTH